MERLTTYHAGKAVIKDKSRLGEAMEKLANIEDAEELFGRALSNIKIIISDSEVNDHVD